MERPESFDSSMRGVISLALVGVSIVDELLCCEILWRWCSLAEELFMDEHEWGRSDIMNGLAGR